MKPCPECGSAERQRGDLMVRGSATMDIRFLPDNATIFSLKKRVRALACPDCGHIELRLEEVVEDSK